MKSKKTLLLIIIVMMSVIGLLSTDMYLPSLPNITQEFQILENSTQLTISLFLAGLCFSQLIYGPLSQIFGRKHILLIGMSIFILASILCLFSKSIEMLIISRLFQGIGAASGLTIGRTIIGDVFSKKEAVKIFATVFPFVGLSPAIAPVIGGYIQTYFNWRISFALLSLLGIILLLLIIFFLPDTLDKSHKSKISLKHIFGTYGTLIKNKIFIGYALIPCIAYIAYFAYITESAFMLSDNGYSAKIIGMSYISLSLSYVAGNLTSRKLLKYFKINKVLLIGYLIFAFSGIMMLLLSSFEFSLILFLMPITFLTFANGFLIPLGAARVITNFSKVSGYASGLLGFLQLGSASISSAFISFIANKSYSILSLFIFIIAIIGFLLFYKLVVRANIISK